MSVAGEEQLDFRSSIEALFVEALRERMTPRLKTRLAQAGVDLERLEPAYPRLIFARACRVTIEELFPADPPDEALRMLGRLLLEGYSKTMIGKAMMGVFALLGIRRSMDRLTRAFRNGDNYTETKFEVLGPGRIHLAVNQVNGQPTFTLGMLDACLEWVKAKNGRASIHALDGDGCVYLVEWDEG